MNDRIRDEMVHDRRPHAVLLDRTRRDLNAWVHPTAIEAFGFMYVEADRLNQVFKAPPSWRREGKVTADWEIDYLDRNLILSMDRKGWRAEQIENVLKSNGEDDDSSVSQIEGSRRGLKYSEG